MPEWDRAVAVVAHPDDLEYGAASAVARWTDQGKQVAYVVASRGEAGIDGMDPSVAGPLREEEERRSAVVVGAAPVDFLGYADGLIQPGLPLRRDIAAALRRLRPDIVITLNFDLTWGDGGSVNHSDHRATGSTVLDACRDAANRWIFPDAGEHWSGIRHVYVAGANDPTHFVDVGASSAAALPHCANIRPTSMAWAATSIPTSSSVRWPDTPERCQAASTRSPFTATPSASNRTPPSVPLIAGCPGLIRPSRQRGD